VKTGVNRWWVIAAILAGIGLWAGMGLATAPDRLKTGHRRHVKELGTECAACHTTIPQSTAASDRNVPNHDVCFECHDGDTAPDECTTCHTNADEAVELPNPPREVLFSHKAHLERGMQCITCHAEAKPGADGELVFGMPDMEACFACHNGQQARLGCETCHTRLATLLPKDHQPGWTQRHSEVAMTDLSTCARCHVQEQDCDLCHRGDNLQGLPHREGFLSSHAFTFYSKTKDCGACHDYQVSCISCHQSRHVFPANHSLANWRERHDGFAQTDMDACAACHDNAQPTCLRCHEGSGEIEDD